MKKLIGLFSCLFLLGIVLFSCNGKKKKTSCCTNTVNVNHKTSPVILKLFAIQTDQTWKVKVPEADVMCELNHFSQPDTLYKVYGNYAKGDERGTLSLAYKKLTPYNKHETNTFFFVAPFTVSNQGSGVFYYLGFFKMNNKNGLITQTRKSAFLGDRIRIDSIEAKNKDVIVSIRVRSAQEPMVAEPTEEKKLVFQVK